MVEFVKNMLEYLPHTILFLIWYPKLKIKRYVRINAMPPAGPLKCLSFETNKQGLKTIFPPSSGMKTFFFSLCYDGITYLHILTDGIKFNNYFFFFFAITLLPVLPIFLGVKLPCFRPPSLIFRHINLRTLVSCVNSFEFKLWF